MTRTPAPRDDGDVSTPPAPVCDALGDRGVSFTVSYVLTLAIAVLLVAGVVIATGDVVRDQRESTIRSEATVVGDRVAASVMAADRLVGTGVASRVTMAVDLPDRVADTAYTVSLNATGTPAVVVETESPSVRVRVPVAADTDITSTSVAGGDVHIVYRPESGALTLRDVQ